MGWDIYETRDTESGYKAGVGGFLKAASDEKIIFKDYGDGDCGELRV